MTTNETSAPEDTRYGDGDRTGAHRIDADSLDNRDAGNLKNNLKTKKLYFIITILLIIYISYYFTLPMRNR